MLVKQGINIQFVHNLPMQKISSLWFAADIAILFLFYIICSHISMEKKNQFLVHLKRRKRNFLFLLFFPKGFLDSARRRWGGMFQNFCIKMGSFLRTAPSQLQLFTKVMVIGSHPPPPPRLIFFIFYLLFNLLLPLSF